MNSTSGSAADVPDNVSRPRRRKLSLLLTGTVVMIVAGAVSLYFVLFKNGGETQACPSSQENPASAVDKETGGDEHLQIVDSGFASYHSSVDSDSERASFGAMLENTSDLVLFDALVTLSLVDSNGDDPTEGFPSTVLEDNTHSLTVHVPVLLPGQQVGTGGTVATWESLAEDPDTGEPFEPDAVDYDALEVEVDSVNAAWITADSGEYEFVEFEPASGGIVEAEPLEGMEYITNGDAAIAPSIEYRIKSTHCGELAAYAPSAVAYDADGTLVGGRASANGGNETARASYSPGDNEGEMSFQIPDVDEVTVEVFPYTAPVKPASS